MTSPIFNSHNTAAKAANNQRFRMPFKPSMEQLADEHYQEIEDQKAISRKLFPKNRRDHTDKLFDSIAAKKETFPGQPDEITSWERDVAQVGLAIKRDDYIDQQTRRREQKYQSDDVVERLESCGIRGRQDRNLSYVDLVSGKTEQITDYRNTNFIPTVQSRNVHNMMQHVQHFCDKRPDHTLRMLVVSGGWVPLNDYRSHHMAHTRRMSTFASKVRKRYGLHLAYYNVENTIQRHEGQAMLNMHSHGLLHVPRKLSKVKWAEFIEFSRNFFPKGYMHDERIHSAKEVVKYVFKPAEFKKLTDEEFAELFYQVAGGREKHNPDTGEIEMRFDSEGVEAPVMEKALKFFHPLGEMKKFRASLKRQNRKLIRHYNFEKQRHEWRTTERREGRSSDTNSTSMRYDNIALAVTAPMPYFSERRSSVIVVENYNGDFADLIKMNGLEQIQARNAALYRKRIEDEKNSSFMKHTTTTTVSENYPDELKYPPPSDPVITGFQSQRQLWEVELEKIEETKQNCGSGNSPSGFL